VGEDYRLSFQSDVTLDTWVFADHHFGHKNIRKLCGRPEDHHDLMVRAWQAYVQPDDVVLHLGDLSYKADPGWLGNVLAGLPGRKIMILGNHDKPWAVDMYRQFGWHVLGRKPHLWWGLKKGKGGPVVCFSHEPDSKYGPGGEKGGWGINVHGHIHNHPWFDDIPMRDYRNVSVEVTNYRPVRLRSVLSPTWPSRLYQHRQDRPWNEEAYSAAKAGGPDEPLPGGDSSASTSASTEPS
jgi:calcineurin-like phosphoesterase family protein